MMDILYAFYVTMELWILLAVLGIALCIEQGYLARRQRNLVDRPTV